jgi:carbon monoxide dehydrogenase subunit G
MRLEHSFDVPVPVEQAWAVLLDVERIAPCMPGATLTEFADDHFAGTVRVKLGPVNLTYKGTGQFVQRDADNHQVVIAAHGRDSRSAGTAAATVTAQLRPAGETTTVHVVTELDVTGRPAQFGRGMLADVSGKLIGQFAACLADRLASDPTLATASTQAPAEPVAPAESIAPAAGPAAPQAPVPDVLPGQAPAEALAGAAAAPAATPAAPAAAPAAVSTVEAPAAGTTSRAVAGPPAEPIDLLAVMGVGARLRRSVPYLVAFVVGAVVGAVITRWLG